MYKWLQCPVISYYPPIAYMMFVLAIALGTTHTCIPAAYDYLSELTAFLSDTCLLKADDQELLAMAKRVETAFLEIYLVDVMQEVKNLTPKPKSELFLQVFAFIIDNCLTNLAKRECLALVDMTQVAANIEYLCGNATRRHLEKFFNLSDKEARREREAQSKGPNLPDGLVEAIQQRVFKKAVNIKSSLIFGELWQAGGSNNVKTYHFPSEPVDGAKENAASRFRDRVLNAYLLNSTTLTTRKRKHTPKKMTTGNQVRDVLLHLHMNVIMIIRTKCKRLQTEFAQATKRQFRNMSDKQTLQNFYLILCNFIQRFVCCCFVD